MLPPRYRIRVKTTKGIEVSMQRTRAEAEQQFGELLRDAPPDRLLVQMEDSGKERGTFKPIAWCDLTKRRPGYPD